jgi:chloride channel 3/4/5
MEMLLEVFKKMGLRYVIICKGGKLLGLITKKDILRQLRHSNQSE